MTAQSTTQDQANYSAAVIQETNLKLPILLGKESNPAVCNCSRLYTYSFQIPVIRMQLPDNNTLIPKEIFH